jgi:hypothetical protein
MSIRGIVFIPLLKKIMLEQQLINAFMKFSAKAGAGDLIRELIQRIEENGNPKSWTALEMERAIEYLNDRVNIFGRNDAITVITTLMKKFDVHPADLPTHESVPKDDALTGIQGLQ